jgi:hypothetical protein
VCWPRWARLKTPFLLGESGVLCLFPSLGYRDRVKSDWLQSWAAPNGPLHATSFRRAVTFYSAFLRVKLLKRQALHDTLPPCLHSPQPTSPTVAGDGSSKVDFGVGRFYNSIVFCYSNCRDETFPSSISGCSISTGPFLKLLFLFHFCMVPRCSSHFHVEFVTSVDHAS